MKKSGDAIVVFSDLLGFSEAVEHNWCDQENFLDDVLEMKDNLETFDYPRVRMSGCTFEAKPHVDLISDSFVFTLFVPDTDDGLPAAFASAAFATKIVSQVAARHGYAVRGGVEFGPIYRDGKHLIGPALGRAYKCESEAAKSVRHIVGPHLIGEILRKGRSPFDPVSWGVYRSRDGLIAIKSGLNGEFLENVQAIIEKSPGHLKPRYKEYIDSEFQKKRKPDRREHWEKALRLFEKK